MTSASSILHSHLGSPPHADCVDVDGSQLCWLCASELQRGQTVAAWNGSSFTGQNRVRCPGAPYVCEACVYLCSRLSPVPGRPPKDGKKYGGNWRNYSHLYDDGDYINCSKGEKPAILSFLRGPRRGPWFAAIADSGQKHTLPWTPINPRGARRGLVLFDETRIQLPACDAGWSLVDRMAGLLTAGATKDELSTGRLTARAWQLCGRDAVSSFEADHGAERGSAWFGLALWLAQRDEGAVAARMAAEKEEKRAKTRRRKRGAAPHNDGGAAAGVALSVPQDAGVQPAEALGSTSEQDVECSKALGNTRRASNAHGTRPSAPSNGQGCLPGVG